MHRLMIIWPVTAIECSFLAQTMSERMITKSIARIVLLFGNLDEVVILPSAEIFISIGKKSWRIVWLTVCSTKIENETGAPVPHFLRIGNDAMDLRQDS